VAAYFSKRSGGRFSASARLPAAVALYCNGPSEIEWDTIPFKKVQKVDTIVDAKPTLTARECATMKKLFFWVRLSG
jgi:hypothetical protein